MFEPIGNTLLQKQKTLEKSGSIQQKSQRALRGFLKENHPAMVEFVTGIYQNESRTLSIVSPKKPVVRGLLLHTKDIRAHLRAAGVPIGKIAVSLPPNS